jgi:enamine deaminase RidA (YjgF/YER057c/UK114 family)
VRESHRDEWHCGENDTDLSITPTAMNEDIKRINIGPRLSDVSIFNRVAYLAGQVPEATIGQGIKEQTAEVLATIDQLLAQAGSDKSRILSCQIFLKDIGQIAEMNSVWEQWIPSGHTPSRATVQAPMASEKWGIEIVLCAALES